MRLTGNGLEAIEPGGDARLDDRIVYGNSDVRSFVGGVDDRIAARNQPLAKTGDQMLRAGNPDACADAGGKEGADSFGKLADGARADRGIEEARERLGNVAGEPRLDLGKPRNKTISDDVARGLREFAFLAGK